MARVMSMPGTPAAVPSLDEVAADPTRATSLPAGALQGLLCRCATVQTVLLGALMAVSSRASDPAGEPDSLLDVAAAATRLGVSRDWLYRHARQLPFTVRNGRLLRFSSHGIDRYIRERQESAN
ncbi:MAG TPA: helix-turn-helix domain-containing protein [Terriglobales bacterium]